MIASDFKKTDADALKNRCFLRACRNFFFHIYLSALTLK